MNPSSLRTPGVVVISDLHLGTYGCHATELCQYLRSVHPQKLILNGDIIDIWQFNKWYWPASHMEVIEVILEKAAKGTEVIYITGNHDEMLRRFEGTNFGSIRIENKLLLDLDGKKYWFFHGDVFDVCMHHSKWLAQLGGKGYDMLILINRLTNAILEKFGRQRISFSARVKHHVKQAVAFMNDFEQLCIDLAARNGYDGVITGHIHHACQRTSIENGREIQYMNSGDWVESLTALEYEQGKWSLMRFQDSAYMVPKAGPREHWKAQDALNRLLAELNAMTAAN